MELKELFFLAKNKNILEQHKLPYTFFTEPVKMLTEEICLDKIIRLLSKNIQFPHNDSSDLFDMIEGKSEFPELYKNLNLDIKVNETSISSLNVKTPYIKQTQDPFVNLICFMKAYASHTYSYKGCFKEYFKDVFDVFYNLNLNIKSHYL